MKKILVTGGNGFVGRSMCKILLSKGYLVTALVRGGQRLLLGVEYVESDIVDVASYEFLLGKVDCIIHLAAKAHALPDHNESSLEKFRQVNRDATLSLFEAALNNGVKRFIFVSSVGVNGRQTFERGFSEEDAPSPSNDYTVSKYEAEQLLQRLFKERQCEEFLTIVRPPLVYGAEAPGSFGRLLKLAAYGAPMPSGLLKNKRSIISKGNLVAFLCECIISENAQGQIFLPADGKDVSTGEMIKLVAVGMNKNIKFIPFPSVLIAFAARILGKQDLYNQLFGSLQINLDKSNRLLGWKAPEDTVEALSDSGAEYVKRLV